MTWDDPEGAAEEYVWQVHGMGEVLPAMYAAPAQVCPACGSEALVVVTAAAVDVPRHLCFSCAADVPLMPGED
jgi:hypothetical protein